MSNPTLGFQGYSGRLGQWTFTKRNGRVFVRGAPTVKSAPTAGQLEVQRQFRLAAFYARETARDPVARVPYVAVAAIRHTSVYQAAMADCLRKPEVVDIVLNGLTGTLGDSVRVLAFDDTEVMSVAVEIRAGDNTLLEQGQATKDLDKWVYVTTVAHPAGTPITITATAVDRPGNRASLTVNWGPVPSE